MSFASYQDFVRFRAQASPCISSLSQHLNRKPLAESQIVFLDYPNDAIGNTEPDPFVVAEDAFVDLLATTPPATTRLLFIENISPSLITIVGEALDVDPLFFSEYVDTSFQDIEEAPLPASLASLPSVISARNHIHLHWQQVVDLGRSENFANAPYALQTHSNVPRNVRRLQPLSGRQLALSRACCAFLVKTMENSRICLFLVDGPTCLVVEASGTEREKIYQAKTMHGGLEDSNPPLSYSSFAAGEASRLWEKRSMLNSLVRCFQRRPPPGFQADSASLLSLGYYPVRIILSDWNFYIYLTSRYSKHYEYSLCDTIPRLHNDDIVDLQRWRRRCKRSQYKLMILSEVITYHLRLEGGKEPWTPIIKDVNYLREELQDFNHSVEQMITVVTTMVQLRESRRSIIEATSVRRLTYIAMVFVPLAWVASLFSMSDTYSPGHRYFWVYFATALPLLGLVLLLSAFPWDRLRDISTQVGGWFRNLIGRYNESRL